jgi:deoxyribonuclease V
LTSEELFQFVDTTQAAALQRDLSTRVKCIDNPSIESRYICGIDAAYESDTAYVAASVWDMTNKETIETTTAVDSVSAKYVPGFLGFREGPLLVKIAEKIRQKPDVFLIDGQGVAHPRRFGLACHVGLALDRPTIGVAKSRLYGTANDSKILDHEGKVIGRILTARNRTFYVSVGHRISLETAANLVEKSVVNGHPSPLRQAHLESIRAKQGGSD